MEKNWRRSYQFSIHNTTNIERQSAERKSVVTSGRKWDSLQARSDGLQGLGTKYKLFLPKFFDAAAGNGDHFITISER